MGICGSEEQRVGRNGALPEVRLVIIRGACIQVRVNAVDVILQSQGESGVEQ